MKPTVHRDGTVSFWSVYRQVWVRIPARDISALELAAMPAADRALVVKP